MSSEIVRDDVNLAVCSIHVDRFVNPIRTIVRASHLHDRHTMIDMLEEAIRGLRNHGASEVRVEAMQ